MSAIKYACVAVIFLVFLQGVQMCRGKRQHSAQSTTPAPPAATQATGQTTLQASVATNPPPGPVVSPGPSPAEIRGQLQVARDRLVETTVHGDNALQTITKWNAELPPLLTTAAGNNIAAHEDLVESLTKIVNAERTPEAELQRKAKRIATLRSDLGNRATSSTPTPLTSTEQKQIDDLEATMNVADNEWTKALDDVRAVKVLADARFEPNKTRSLEDEIKLKAAADRLTNLDEQLEQEKTRKAEDARDKREQARIDAKREQDEAKLAAKRKAEAEAAAEKIRLEAEALIARAHSTEVQSALAPFLHKRKVQPQKVGSGSIKFARVFESQPMSLSALQQIGALEESNEGKKWLARVAGNRKLAEPRWGIASQPGNWSEEDDKLLEEAQQLLRELGPTLVEEKLLTR